MQLLATGMFCFTLLSFSITPKCPGILIVSRFYLVGPILQAAPSFLSETNYQEISIKTKTPFQKAFHTELSVFEWMVQHPNYTRNGQLAMASTQSSDWLQDFQLLEEAVHDFTSCPEPLPNRPFFVDVGGSYGHQTVHLRDKYSGLSGHLVLQDMLEVVEQVPALDGIKVMAQDFFTPQVVQGILLSAPNDLIARC